VNDLVMTGATVDEIWPLVRDFHYSGRLPAVISRCFALRQPGGLFGETGEPVAAIIYGLSANNAWPSGALELQRLVRRDDYSGILSAFVTWSLRWLRANTQTTFAFSYADTGQNHHGGIYQACGWKFVNMSKGDYAFNDEAGNYVHGKTAYDRFGTRSTETVLKINPSWSAVRDTDKFVYVFPLRQKWNTLSRLNGWTDFPFPKPHAARLLDETGTSGSELGANPRGRSNLREAA
jgi:hypothetical protein